MAKKVTRTDKNRTLEYQQSLNDLIIFFCSSLVCEALQTKSISKFHPRALGYCHALTFDSYATDDS